MIGREVLIREAVTRVAKREWPYHYVTYGLRNAVDELRRNLGAPYVGNGRYNSLVWAIRVEYLLLAIRHAPQEIKE